MIYLESYKMTPQAFVKRPIALQRNSVRARKQSGHMSLSRQASRKSRNSRLSFSGFNPVTPEIKPVKGRGLLINSFINDSRKIALNTNNTNILKYMENFSSEEQVTLRVCSVIAYFQNTIFYELLYQIFPIDNYKSNLREIISELINKKILIEITHPEGQKNNDFFQNQTIYSFKYDIVFINIFRLYLHYMNNYYIHKNKIYIKILLIIMKIK